MQPPNVEQSSPATPIRLPTLDEFILLQQAEDEQSRARLRKVLPYCQSSLGIGRHLDNAIVLLLGETGHGKTKTVNRLIGKNLLRVAGRYDGSMTKEVQRVEVPIRITSEEDIIELTVSFDDTPGLEDTISNDRAQNKALMRKYAKENFADIPDLNNTPNTQPRKPYPNVILVVASWNSIKEDDNPRGKFTSSIGKTIDYLPETGLVDEPRQNIIVVVTKSLSFWDDYEDFNSEDDKNDQWKRDAEEKRRIINDLRVEAFPSSSPWPVVFVENGGGASARPRTLPNGDVYPQNLFEKIKDLFAQADAGGIQDLVGIAALQYITGALDSPFEARPPKILYRSDDSAVACDEYNMTHPTLYPIDPRVLKSQWHHQTFPPDVHDGHLISILTANELRRAINLLPRWNPSSDDVQDAYRRLLNTDQTIVDQLYTHPKFAQTHGFAKENNPESPGSRNKPTWKQILMITRTSRGNEKTKDNMAKSHDESGKSVCGRITPTPENLDHNDAAYETNEAIMNMPTGVPATEAPHRSILVRVNNSLVVVSRDPHNRPSSELSPLCGRAVGVSEATFKKLNSLDLLSPVQRNELKRARRFFKTQSENQSLERTLRLKLLEGAETLLANALEAFWKGPRRNGPRVQ